MYVPEFEVRSRDNRRRVAGMVVIALLAVACGFALYELGRQHGGLDRQEMNRLGDRLDTLERDNRALQQRLAHATQSGQVDQQAHAEVRETLGGLNEEILRLREELAFYQGIVSPSDARRGLRVHSFDMRQGAGERAWRYRMMLIQAMQHDRQARGTAAIELVGALDGLPHRLGLDERDFDFRYYQELGGDILLPEGFEPDRVEVTLSAQGGEVEAEFDWPQEG